MGMWLLRRWLFLLLAAVTVCVGGCGGGNGPADDDTDPADSNTRIFGVVYSAADDSPMEGARVTVDGVTGRVLTDTQGRFAFSVPTGGTYAVTAQATGYTYAQRRAEVGDGELVAVPEMFLTPLDSQAIVIGPGGGTGSNSDDSIQLVVPPGALAATTEMRATWFRRGKDLPNFLPELTHFTYACELTPDGTTFRSPATVRMRNTRGFAPGTPIPVGVYSDTTLVWTHESTGTVTADGEWVEFDVEHFSPRDCNLGWTAPSDGGDADPTDLTNTTRMNNQNCGAVRAGSQVGVLDGHLAIDHTIPAYRTLDTWRAVTLQYNSNRVSTDPLLGLSYDIRDTGTLVPQRMRFTAEIGGRRIERYFTPIEGPMFFYYRWDGRDGLGRELAEGHYRYSLTLANEYQAEFSTVPEFGGPAIGSTGVIADEYVGFASTYTGVVFLRRPAEDPWPMGVGWGVVGHYRLTDEDEQVTITGGDGNIYTFAFEGEGRYTTSRGDFSSLRRTATGYEWTLRGRTRITFNTEGLEVTQVDRNGNTIAFTYHPGTSRLATIADPLGRTTTFAYDAGGHLSSITDPYERSTQITIDGDGDLVTIVNPDTNTRSFTYDDDHQLLNQTDAGGQVTAYRYNAAGAVEQVDRPDGSFTQHTAVGAIGTINGLAGTAGSAASPATIANSSYTDGEGGRYDFVVSPFGTRTAITDPLGRTVEMARSADDQVTQLASGESKTTTYVYDSQGRLTEVSGPVEAVAVSDSLRIDYDSETGLPETITDDAVGASAEYDYDANGNLIETTTMDGRTFTFTYNERGQRETAMIDGRTARFAYNDDGNLESVTDPNGGIWSFAYDTYGNVSRATDPDGRQWTATYNAMNLRETVTDGEGNTVRFAYDPAKGSVDLDGLGPVAVIASITDGRNNVTEFGYDQMYRLTEATDPLDHTTRFEYDGEGRLTATIRPNGRRVDYEYSDAGELVSRTFDEADATTYTYDAETGLLTQMANVACRIDLAYDWYELLTEATTTFLPSGFAASVGYEYRQANQQESIVTLSAGDDYTEFAIDYGSDRGYLPANLYGGSWFQLRYDYDAGGRLAGWDELSTVEATATFTHDGADRLTGSTYSGTDTAAYAWTYSGAGYLLEMTDPDGTHEFTYDAAGRLTAAAHPTADNPAEAYSYDDAGNRRIAGQESEFTYDAANRLTADPTCDYGYDNAGNRITATHRVSGAITRYTYDAENRLIGVELPDGRDIAYTYDPAGRLATRDLDGQITRYVYDRDNVLGEFDGDGRLVRQYVNGLGVDHLEGIKEGGFLSPDNYLCHSDRMGTVLALADMNGAVVQSYRYQAFGQPVAAGGAIDNPRLFAGRDYDEATGLYQLRQRFYDPTTGSFLQRDPVPVLGATSPYAYAFSSPTRFRDPYGLDPTIEAQAGGLWTVSWETAVKPAGQQLHGMLAETVVTEAPPMLHESLPDMPGAGSAVSTAIGQYYQWRDVIGVWRSDNPLEAGISWWTSQWWNPVRGMVDPFLTLGGTVPRHQAQIAPVCGFRSGLGAFFAPQLGRSSHLYSR